MKEITKDFFIQCFLESCTITELETKLNLPCNGQSTKYIKEKLLQYGFNIDDLKNRKRQKFYEIRICPVCQKEFEVSKKETTVCCSRKCSNSYFRELRYSEEINKKRSNTLKQKKKEISYTNKKKNISCELRKTQCIFCGKDIYVKTLNDVCCYDCNKGNFYQYQLYDQNGKRIISDKTKEKLSQRTKENIKNGKIKSWKTRNIISYPEKFFIQVLNNNNISYKINFPITKKSLGIESSSCYFLDFYLDKNVDLEIDGKQHFYSDRKQSDLVRDEILSKNGYIVYRIAWNEINSEKGKELMKQKINNFLEWYSNLSGYGVKVA